MSIELKPCPFCEGEAETYDTENRSFTVYCRDCGIELEDCDSDRAIANWNRRSPTLKWTTEKPTEPGWYLVQRRATNKDFWNRPIWMHLPHHELSESRELKFLGPMPEPEESE